VSQAPGWYPDPFHRGQQRYWDGKLWTQGTQAEGAAEHSDGSGAQDAAAPFYAPSGSPAGPADTQPLGVPASSSPTSAGPAYAGGRDRKQRRTALAVGAAALVLVAGAVSAVLVLGGSSTASAQEAVANAATQTMNAQTADVSISMDISTEGVKESMSGSGGFDFAQKTATMSLTVPVGGQQDTVQEIVDGSTIYVNVGALGGDLSKPWISEDVSQLNSVSGGFGTLDPASMLQRLQSLGGTVTSLGSTTYDNTAVTEYSAIIPASAMEGELGKLPALQQAMSGVTLPNVKEDIYVTSDDLLKAVAPSFSISAGGQSVSMDMTLVFSNYGTTVNAVPPPPDEVEPLGALGAGGLGDSGSTGNTGTSL
jgi:Protein of unknown function (DUF2510)